MKRNVSILVGAGLSLVSLTIVLIARPAFAEQLGFTSLLTIVENGYYIVVGVAGIGFFYAMFIGMSWWMAGGVEQADVPTVEAFDAGSVPGLEFDTALLELAGKRGRAARPVTHRELIRDRLRMDAIHTLARVENYSTTDASALVDSGEWTENRYASGFLGDETAPGPRWYQRAIDWILRRDAFSRHARQTVTALIKLEERD